MKRLLSLLTVLTALSAQAQTRVNAISDTASKIGIGTTTPTSRLQVSDNNRNYYVNRYIPGSTGDSQGLNYLLLHEIYDSATHTLITDKHVMGKITGIRGAAGAYNRKFTIEVNTASAYNTNIGSLVTYNEKAVLVTVVFNGKKYLAVEIANLATLSNFSFTGYAASEAFRLVKLNEVSGRTLFAQSDIIGMPGGLNTGNLAVTGASTFSGGATFTGGPAWTTNNWAKSVKLPVNSAIEFAGTTRSFGLGSKNDGLYFSNVNPDGSGASNYYMIADGTTGNMTIGGVYPDAKYKLTVEGALGARRIKVVQTGWPDYVFHGDYQLPALQEVEHFVNTHHHLPGIPSEKEVTEDGLDLGEFDRQLLKKVEELTLYIIQLNKNVDSLNKKVAAQQEVIADLSKK